MNDFTNIGEINRRAINMKQQLLRLVDEADDHETDESERVSITPPTVDPFDFDEVGGLLGSCARWVLGNARSPISELAMFAAIIFLASAFGRRAVGPTGLGLNLYLVMVAPTGSGKDWPLNAPRVLFRSLGAFGNGRIGPTNVTGDSAIERALQASPCFYMAMDEFGLLLQGATNPKAPAWTQTISRALLELYSRSGPHGSWKAKSTAAKVKGVKDSPVEQPTVLILGATTPDEFYKGLTTASTSNGLLNRLVVIAVSDRPEMQDVAAIPTVPKQLSDDIKAALEGFPKPGGGAFKGVALADASMQATMHAIPYADDAAKDRFRQVQRDQRKMLESDSDLAGIVERVAENAIKLATLRAISNDPVNPAVSVADIEWGWALIHRSIDSVNHGVARYMAGSNAEALRKLVYGHIQDAGGGGIPKSWLMKKRGVPKATQFELDGALQWLERSGQIANVGKADQRGGRGRSGEKFVATQFMRAAA